MTYLTQHLPFTTTQPLPPPGAHLVISDTLTSPADFTVYHLVAAALASKRKVQRPSRGLGLY